MARAREEGKNQLGASEEEMSVFYGHIRAYSLHEHHDSHQPVNDFHEIDRNQSDSGPDKLFLFSSEPSTSLN